MQFTLEMDMPNEQGTTQRESLQHVLNSTPQDSPPYLSARAQLDEEPEIPYCLQHVWDWFWELNSGRPSGFNGPEPLTYSEIQSWKNVKEILVRDFEIDIIKYLDTLYLNHINAENKKKSRKKK